MAPQCLPEWLYPGGGLVAAALLLAHLLDLVYPFHRGILLTMHPVHTSFILAKKLAPPGSSRLRGIVTWIVVVGSHLVVYAALLYAAWRLGPLAWLFAAAWVLKVSFSLRLLLETVWRAASCMERDDMICARRLVQGLVRRDVYRLSLGHVASAAVESLAESLVDGYTSPIFYTVLLGPLGALLQRLANTLDGTLGFKTPDYLEAGWASAWADTLLNYLPARMTAVLLVLVTPLVGGNPRETLRVWRCYARVTESRNAGHPMSAMAGALEVRLEKPGSYVLGAGPLPGPRDMKCGVMLTAAAAAVWLAVATALLPVLD
ncbi:putative cobalamin biosynthesis protein [Pyrodictium delaneyi]|uniref:Probable cobalamin biosynthesis protein CobD n=1 Tax=Pyrodictium delaneyi TaxID=1273541 RepID=A0A0P0N5L5_9CREN|nr:cobalamin biosynthesis protein [Pyrodictium delaneyi]ALL01530.1 putative cobalamin biosynthesis protein [Pyrodictium delaneyi]